MDRPFVISISGISGSGKTTVRDALKAQLANAVVISFDDYGERVYLDRDINEWSEDSSYDEWHTESIAADVERLLKESLDYIILDYANCYGSRKIVVYPDTVEEIISLITEAGLSIQEQFETEFAVVSAARKGM
jgi:uridine kinase